MNTMFFTAYASSAAIMPSERQLLDMLAVARTNNLRDDITGLLLYRGGSFLQALEGPEAAVRETMRRISLDTRHRAVMLLYEGTHDHRLFGEWSMAFEEVKGIDEDQHPGLSHFLSRSQDVKALSADSDHDVFEFFASFRDNMV